MLIALSTPETSAPVGKPAVQFLPAGMSARKVRYHQKLRGNHFLQGSLCGDPDAPVVIWGFASLQEFLELQTALFHYVLEQMAKALPMAAEVLPAASKGSAIFRTCMLSSDISAMPPALTEMGP